MEPSKAPTIVGKTKKIPTQRHFLAVFFISFIWGTYGVDRMYLGKWGTGILKVLTLGGFGLWTIIDLILIMNGSMRDRWNRPMAEFEQYKRLAYRVVLVFAVVLGAVILISGLITIYSLTQLITGMQDGTIPGLDALQNFSPTGLTPEQQAEFGL